jgi:hypothetical protein
MSIHAAKAACWCPESGATCPLFRVGLQRRARCPQCGRWLRPRVTADETEVLPHHLPEKPRRGR